MAPADTLVCDTAQVAAWQSDPAFAYSRELIAPEINVLEWFISAIAACLFYCLSGAGYPS